MRVTRIEWLDANQLGDGWTQYEALDNHRLCTVETSGFIHEENDQFITIIQSHCENDDFMNAIAIPKSCIVERKDFV